MRLGSSLALIMALAKTAEARLQGAELAQMEAQTLLKHGRRLAVTMNINATEISLGYEHHGSRSVAGAHLGRRLENRTACVEACDSMGLACAGFAEDVSEGKCQMVARGYGLERSAITDFYRKRPDPETTSYEIKELSMVPSPDVYAWYGVNGTLAEIRAACSKDTQCQGFYTCSDGETTGETSVAGGCVTKIAEKHASLKIAKSYTYADAVLLSAVPAGEKLLPEIGITTHTKLGARTCGGTAEGASCTFPFLVAGAEYYEPTIVKSDRPYCYTSKPGLWGYTDCYGQDSLGAAWKISTWSTWYA